MLGFKLKIMNKFSYLSCCSNF